MMLLGRYFSSKLHPSYTVKKAVYMIRPAPKVWWYKITTFCSPTWSLYLPHPPNCLPSLPSCVYLSPLPTQFRYPSYSAFCLSLFCNVRSGDFPRQFAEKVAFRRRNTKISEVFLETYLKPFCYEVFGYFSVMNEFPPVLREEEPLTN